MKITTRGRYAVRAIVCLAYQSRGNPVSIKEISKKERISQKYLHQLFQKMRNANIVKSIRGPGGGFVLARHPSLISIWEIISSVEQNFSQIGCHRESKKVCNIIDGCKTQLMWEKLSEKMEDFLDSITVESLIKDAFYGRMEAAGEESIF
jgi:Rrf2 family protein